jgi:hypothetical protein
MLLRLRSTSCSRGVSAKASESMLHRPRLGLGWERGRERVRGCGKQRRVGVAQDEAALRCEGGGDQLPGESGAGLCAAAEHEQC